MQLDERSKKIYYLRDFCSQGALFADMAREMLMTNLAPRIYKLSKSFYMGCGFHYSLEQQLGACIKALALATGADQINGNSLDYFDKYISEHIMNEICVTELCQQVIDAERSATELENKY